MDDTRQAFTRRGYPERKTCADCGTVYYSAGAHLERCPGPRKHQVRMADQGFAADISAADEAASVAHDFIYGKNGVTQQQASDAIWLIHNTLRPLAARLSGLQDTLAARDKVLFMAATAAHEYARHKGDIERCNHHPCDLAVVKEVVAATRRAALALNADGPEEEA